MTPFGWQRPCAWPAATSNSMSGPKCHMSGISTRGFYRKAGRQSIASATFWIAKCNARVTGPKADHTRASPRGGGEGLVADVPVVLEAAVLVALVNRHAGSIFQKHELAARSLIVMMRHLVGGR